MPGVAMDSGGEAACDERGVLSVSASSTSGASGWKQLLMSGVGARDMMKDVNR